MVPVLSNDCQVNLAKGLDFDQIAERMQSLSSELGTTEERPKDRLAIDPRQSHQPLVKQVGYNKEVHG